MKHGHFVWADLSTYDLGKARQFYSRGLSWRLSDGGDGYLVGANATGDVAGIYTMPPKFVQIGMPSFWMSYIQVDSADRAAEVATAMGGKVEVGPEDMPGTGRFALIRDPLGAGFTVIERPNFGSAPKTHALFVEDANRVIPFYEALFGWAFTPDGDDRWVISADGTLVAELHQIPDPAIRGKEQYWGVVFSADPASLAAAGAIQEAEVPLRSGPHTLWRDDQGAAFFTSNSKTVDAPVAAFPRLAVLGFALIAVAIVTGWGWITAIFFAVWVAGALRDRAVYLFEPVYRDSHPALYWVILLLYAGLGGLALYGYT